MKTIFGFTAFLLCLSLTACGSQNDKPIPTTDVTQDSANVPDTAVSDTTQTDQGGAFGGLGQPCLTDGTCNEGFECINGVCEVAASDAGSTDGAGPTPNDTSATDTNPVPEDIPCNASCGDKQCGDDGCGGSCGECNNNESCILGYCELSCIPDCLEDQECGDDGCGGSCGECSGLLPVCNAGTCVASCSPACQLTGTVLAPEGSIPISGASVHLTTTPPLDIPQELFCDKCQDLPANIPQGTSAADGTFSIVTPVGGEYYLVVQKGGFRKVSTIEIQGGTQELDASLTTLPADTNVEANEWAPRIAIVDASYDDIKNTMAKLGLGEVNSSGVLVNGTETFDLYGTPSFFDDGEYAGDQESLLNDYDTLANYHIVFFPCDSSWPNSLLAQQAVKDNLTEYVKNGGRLYVTDWSYDVLRQAFPDPITWYDDDGTFDSGHTGSYDADAEPPVPDTGEPDFVNTGSDPSLWAWLNAQGIDEFEVEDNWTVIQSANTYTAPDENFMLKEMETKVWVVGSGNLSSFGSGSQPNTVSFQWGCGRAMFSTYHTEPGFGADLVAQERALLYIILEVLVCTRGN